MSDSDILAFYENLAADYENIFADWRASVRRQGRLLNGIICDALGVRPEAVLDCACGIGTQAIGLALHGYTVHATDISPAPVALARQYAAELGASLGFGVADMRQLDEQVAGSFDVVIACDNAIPHLLTDEDLRAGLQGTRRKLKPGGLLVLTLRDYDALHNSKPRSFEPAVYDGAEGRRVVFQIWQWAADGKSYSMTLFIMQETDEGWETKTFTTPYRALLRVELESALLTAGFEDIRWLMPDESGYYQPVVTARTPQTTGYQEVSG